MVRGGGRKAGLTTLEAARLAQQWGAGEIILQSIDREGTLGGYDLDLVRAVAGAVEVPVVALGGAGNIEHFVEALAAGASAVAAGTMFVLHGPHRAVLVTYPPEDKLRPLLAAGSRRG
jgi:cyclase